MKKNRLCPFRPGKWAIWMVIRDIVNYFDWIKTIKKEKANPKSLWHKFGMNHNYFYTVYFPVTLPEEDKNLPEHLKRVRVVESTAPAHRYIDEDLKFAEYIVPEFNQFYDDNNMPTLTYGIVYRFAFKRLSLLWVISRILIWTGIIFSLVKWPIINTVTEFITSFL